MDSIRGSRAASCKRSFLRSKSREIDKPKPDDKPPPPPPKLEDIKPYVPPPEFVDISGAGFGERDHAGRDDQITCLPRPPSLRRCSTRHTNIRQDPKHPLHIGEEYYPDASKRANEEGRCVVKLTVAADGRIVDQSIQQSSGFPRLDDACLKGVRGQRMLPATEDGKPVETTVGIPIVWKLKN